MSLNRHNNLSAPRIHISQQHSRWKEGSLGGRNPATRSRRPVLGLGIRMNVHRDLSELLVLVEGRFALIVNICTCTLAQTEFLADWNDKKTERPRHIVSWFDSIGLCKSIPSSLRGYVEHLKATFHFCHFYATMTRAVCPQAFLLLCFLESFVRAVCPTQRTVLSTCSLRIAQQSQQKQGRHRIQDGRQDGEYLP
jgi:hypothetical protein